MTRPWERKHRLGLLLIGVVLTAGTACRSSRFGDQGVFEVELRLIPGRSLVGLPVAVEIALVNTGDRGVSAKDVIGIHQKNVRITVRTPEGVEIPIETVAPRGNPLPYDTAGPVPPGEARICREWISFSWAIDGPVLGRPGEYSVVAEVVRLDGRWVSSRPGTLLIREPQGRDAVAAEVYAPLGGAIETRSPGTLAGWKWMEMAAERLDPAP
ncbi:MAG: hypothetical protein O7H41_17025 [Planctomycetota bacterium]|nr:hypothetical protein [Planctomycetota bacterium]